ncbi:hypothetical protein [Methylopila sp. 73B]|uniref:hypothetical protein n=1 Tax=Methylopila sp. 73B TaxID=1120792 RepID=UPI00037CAA3A|nr:hypothetical protein [Methylopila sp. 73B]
MQTIEITAEHGFSGYPDSFPDGPKDDAPERAMFFAPGSVHDVADDYADLLIEKGLAKRATKAAVKAAERAEADAKAAAEKAEADAAAAAASQAPANEQERGK